MPNRRKNKSAVRIVVILVVLILVLAGAGCMIFVKKSLAPAGKGNKKVVLTIESGENLDSIISDLKKYDLIQSKAVTKVYAKVNHVSNYVAGTFELNDGMSIDDIFSYISDTKNLKKDIKELKIPEGKWAKEIAASISELYHGKYSTQQIIDQWNDINYITTLAKDYSFLNVEDLNNSNYKVKLEGYLFPDTYYLEKDATIDDITRTMLDRFDIMYKENKADIEKSKYSIHQIVSMASVVQFEASSMQDMKMIAGVFQNRLDQNMKLESSVTVCYALYDNFSDPKDCETNPNLDSPYNTYIYEGLPIGPILNPGEDAIKAVLHPEKSDYLYFAADIYHKVDGKVHYSKTYEEHQKVCEELGLNL